MCAYVHFLKSFNFVTQLSSRTMFVLVSFFRDLNLQFKLKGEWGSFCSPSAFWTQVSRFLGFHVLCRGAEVGGLGPSLPQARFWFVTPLPGSRSLQTERSHFLPLLAARRTLTSSLPCGQQGQTKASSFLTVRGLLPCKRSPFCWVLLSCESKYGTRQFDGNHFQ